MVWPGQALGYKIGQLRILGLRRKAEAALGGAFDVRAFHDELLRDGAMPLDVLERKMDRWLAARQRGSSQPPLAAGRSRLLQPRLFLKVPHRDPADGHRVGVQAVGVPVLERRRRGRRSAW